MFLKSKEVEQLTTCKYPKLSRDKTWQRYVIAASQRLCKVQSKIYHFRFLLGGLQRPNSPNNTYGNNNNNCETKAEVLPLTRKEGCNRYGFLFPRADTGRSPRTMSKTIGCKTLVGRPHANQRHLYRRDLPSVWVTVPSRRTRDISSSPICLFTISQYVSYIEKVTKYCFLKCQGSRNKAWLRAGWYHLTSVRAM